MAALETFEKNPYPSLEELNGVSQRLNLSVKQIKLWMKHRRSTLCRRGEISFLRNRTTKHSLRAEDVAALRGARVITAAPTAEQFRALAAHLQVDTPLVTAWFERQSKDSVCDSSPSQPGLLATAQTPGATADGSAAEAQATAAAAVAAVAVAAAAEAAGDASAGGAVSGLQPSQARGRSGSGASHKRSERSCSPSETSSFNAESTQAGRGPLREGAGVPPPWAPAVGRGRKVPTAPSQAKRQRTSLGGSQAGEARPTGGAAAREGADEGAKVPPDVAALGASLTPDLREPWARTQDPRVAPPNPYASPNLGESLGTTDTLPTMTPPLMQPPFYQAGFYSPIPVQRDGMGGATPSFWANVGGGRRQQPLPQEVSMTSPLLRQPAVVMRSETGRSFPSPMPSPSLVGPAGFAPAPAQAAEQADLFPGVNPQAGMAPHPAMFYTFPPPHSFHPMYQSQMMQFGMPRLPGGGAMAPHPMPYPAMPNGQTATTKGLAAAPQDGGNTLGNRAGMTMPMSGSAAAQSAAFGAQPHAQ